MRNAEIAAAMSELATLYELDGAIRYRVLAYKEAARVIRQSPVSVEELALAGKATELPGIGETLQTKIVALVETGEIPSATKLKAKFPPSLIEVTRIPGLGAKTVRRLHDELGVASLDDLRDAADHQRIRALKGLGPKVEENVIEALERLGEEGPAERLLLSEVLPIAEELAAALRDHPASDAVAVAGSARRMAETCKDIDLIATAPRPGGARGRARPSTSSSAQAGSAGRLGYPDHDPQRDLRRPADRRARRLRQPAPALHRLGQAQRRAARTGAQGRALGLRARDHRRGDGRGGALRHRGARSTSALGLAYIEPELREGSGEIAAAAERRAARAGRDR